MPTRGRPRIHSTDEPTKPARGRKPVAPPPPPVYDSLAETRSLIGAILRARGDHGATPEILRKVVAWARAVRAETDALHDLAGRQRRAKTGTEPDRALVNEMNRALLDGVLDGAITIRVADDGGISFAAAQAIRKPREITIEELTAVDTLEVSGEPRNRETA